MIMPMAYREYKAGNRKVDDKKGVNFHFMWSHLSLLGKLSQTKFSNFCWNTSDRDGHTDFATGIKLVTQILRVYQSKVLHTSLQF